MPGNPANMQAMANDPAELIRILEEASFLPPDQYDARLRELRQLYQAKAEFPIIPQLLDEKTDPRRSIVAAEIEQSANMLVGFAEKSRTDGHLLWGRIQGTEYELAAHRWIRDELTRMGLQDVHYVEMACQLPQWTPSKIALDISYSPEGKAPQTFSFDSAITAFISATTDDGGVSGEVVYAGEGTAAELNGRDLNGKVVLLKARTLSSALLSTARTAYSRIATGKWGMPRGVIVWWDVPFAKQIAGRVGAPGGADDIGLALPWTSIGYTDGLYLRKLLDRHPTLGAVTAKLIVQGTQEPPSSRTTANTYAILPGTEDQYIVIPTHVDGYFYGLHDNGGAVSINLALAKYGPTAMNVVPVECVMSRVA